MRSRTGGGRAPWQKGRGNGRPRHLVCFAHITRDRCRQCPDGLGNIPPRAGNLCGISRGHPDYHGFAESPHGAEEDGGKNAARSRGKHDEQQRLSPRSPEGVALYFATNGLKRIFRYADDRRQSHHTQNEGCGERVRPAVDG